MCLLHLLVAYVPVLTGTKVFQVLSCWYAHMFAQSGVPTIIKQTKLCVAVVPLAFTLYLYGQQTKRLMPTRTFALWSKALPVLYSLFSSEFQLHMLLLHTMYIKASGPYLPGELYIRNGSWKMWQIVQSNAYCMC